MAGKQSDTKRDTTKQTTTEVRKGGVGYNPPATVDPVKQDLRPSKPRPKK